jgi:hypothetical protein
MVPNNQGFHGPGHGFVATGGDFPCQLNSRARVFPVNEGKKQVDSKNQHHGLGFLWFNPVHGQGKSSPFGTIGSILSQTANSRRLSYVTAEDTETLASTSFVSNK